MLKQIDARMTDIGENQRKCRGTPDYSRDMVYSATGQAYQDCKAMLEEVIKKIEAESSNIISKDCAIKPLKGEQ